ncbi:MAG TPA: alanine--tRNA ligase-related protein [Candidatus Paceibacterota bacterium]|nr:alanine--tRNA ligase-related protein [Candidatus Paceibacterota bacterium]
MSQQEIRQKFIEFFQKREHALVASSSLLPDDASVLLTTAGMQQFKPYYTGAASPMTDFGSLNTVSIQKCMRTSDIEEVGDQSHLTFFEMLGNFSFGGYWKKEAIQLAYEFITKEMGLTIGYVTVFGGNEFVPRDDESAEIWASLDSSLKIVDGSVEDNFWGPTGNEGPCGPTTEIYVNGLEVWNIVFNQFYYNSSREQLLAGNTDFKLATLDQTGIDTGMGIERLAMVVQKKSNLFETDLFQPIIQIMPDDDIPERVHRIIADHSRAIAFLVCDGVTPSNKEQGYILRRLMRRLIVQCHLNGIELETIADIFDQLVTQYGPFYPELNADTIKTAFNAENDKFQKTFKKGLAELDKMSAVDDAGAFKLYESFGLPFDIIAEVAGDKAKGLTRDGFEAERKRHQEISRAGAEKKFGGHGIIIKEGDLSAENDEELKKKTRLHTATHVVVAALEHVLGQKLPQAGSDINAERLRFDFKFPRKVTPEELKQAEDLANQIVERDLTVTWQEMELQAAFASGASGAFKHKYPPRVKVYTIEDPEDSKGWFSRELCGGPHVTHTGMIGHIRITKEESVSGGNRRIRASIN